MLHVAQHEFSLCYCTKMIKLHFCLTSTVQ